MSRIARRVFLRGALATGAVAAAPVRASSAGPTSTPAPGTPAPGTSTPASGADAPVRVYLVVVDGLRPDEVALMPTLSSLASEGTYYPEARADMVAETSTNHASMITGMRPTRHGIAANAVPTLPVRPSDEPRYLKADSLFTLLARQAPELVTAAIGAKTYVADLCRHDRTGDGDTDAGHVNEPLVVVPVALDSAPDEETGTEAVVISREHDPDLLFLNLGDVDRMGHFDEVGGMTEGQLPALRRATLLRADAQIARLVDELRRSGRWDSTVFMVTADHSMDWSRRDRGLNLAPRFQADELLRDEVLAAINGGASLYALRSPDEPRAGERLRRMRELALEVEGIEHALYLRPNPSDGGERHWVGRVFPQWGLAGDMVGDMIVTVAPGYRLGHDLNAPEVVANPIPGNHGHPTTLPIPIVVAGGWEGVRSQDLTPAGELSVTDEDPSQARNIDLAPTAAWLLGLHGPPGGFDGRVLAEAFDRRPAAHPEIRDVVSMPSIARLAGDDAAATAARLSRAGFPEGTDTVVVVDGPLSGAVATPLAVTRRAPVLPAGGEDLPAVVLDEIVRLGARRAYLVGDPAVLSERVAARLRSAGVEDLVRLAGTDGPEVAHRVAVELADGGELSQAVVVRGDPASGVALDALVAGPVAAGGHPRSPTPDDGLRLPNQGDFTAGGGVGARPLLLVGRDRIPPATELALEQLGIERVVLVGGPLAVSVEVEEDLRRRGLLVERIGGETAGDTARAVAERGIREGAFTDSLFLVSDADPGESLAAGAAVGRLGGTLMLAPRTALPRGEATRQLLTDRADELVRVRLVGGRRSFTEGLLRQVTDLVHERRTRSG
jgi:ectonucleotide pyrophosphatase/phosphodiesterase family member 5